MLERKWQMTRIGDGDWLLPSNDRTVLWRIRKYQEDGSASWGNERPIFGTYWSVWKWTLPIESSMHEDPREWDHWDEWVCMLKSRQAGIDWAMRADAERERKAHDGQGDQASVRHDDARVRSGDDA